MSDRPVRGHTRSDGTVVRPHTRSVQHALGSADQQERSEAAAQAAASASEENLYSDEMLADHSSYAADFAWEEWEHTFKHRPEMEARWSQCVDAWDQVKMNGYTQDPDSSLYAEYDSCLSDLACAVYDESGVEPPFTPDGFDRREWYRWVEEEAVPSVKAKMHEALVAGIMPNHGVAISSVDEESVSGIVVLADGAPITIAEQSHLDEMDAHSGGTLEFGIGYLASSGTWMANARRKSDKRRVACGSVQDSRIASLASLNSKVKSRRPSVFR